jgi:transcription-repair coupling factor (superfamily II helicase)
MLRETAEKRLGAIREYTELGSGFRIAMRDLEIRGAGNMLGKAQSGHMAEVGYDLYCKLLNASVMKLKGESTVSSEFDTAIDLTIDAFLPDSYISNENQKLDLYKRIASITGQEDYEDMLDELMDRYGEPPRSVQNLLKVALLKSKAHDVYLTELTQKNDELCFVLWQKAPIDPDKVGPFMQRYQRRLRFVAGDKPHFAYILPAGGGGICDVLGEAEHLIDDMQQELLATE